MSKTFFVNFDARKASTRSIREVYGIFEYLKESEKRKLCEFFFRTCSIDLSSSASERPTVRLDKRDGRSLHLRFSCGLTDDRPLTLSNRVLGGYRPWEQKRGDRLRNLVENLLDAGGWFVPEIRIL